MAAWCGCRHHVSWSSYVFFLLAVVVADVTAALTQLYCSNQNTGSDRYVGADIYQSNGACFDNCKSTFAFAIVQYQDCWCSNYIPSNTVSTDACQEPCPGFPDEDCGSRSAGLFGYVPLIKEPLGTWTGSGSTISGITATNAAVTGEQVVSSESSGAPFSSLSSAIRVSVAPASTSLSTLVPGPFVPLPSLTSSLTSSPLTLLLTSFVQSLVPEPSPVTVEQTVTASPSVRISLITLAPSTTTPIATASNLLPTVSLDPTPAVASPNPNTAGALPLLTSTWSATPFVSVITVTGQVKTLTVTPTVPAESTTSTVAVSSAGKSFAPPQIIGLAVGLVSGLSIIVVMALWWWFLRRKKRSIDERIDRVGDGTPQRRPSRLSEMGLVSGSPRKAGEKGVPSIQTSGWGPSTHVEKSPSDANTPLDLRSSYPRVVDQRLDPVALWNPLHDNGSHVSVRSFQDDQDYSRRMLRIANPDEH